MTQDKSNQYYVFVIPIAKELDLKAAAKSVGEKSVEMIHVKDITKVTGYVRGGCSPLGMKKAYDTVFDISALDHDTIVISGGRIGSSLRINPEELIKVTGAKAETICRQEA